MANIDLEYAGNHRMISNNNSWNMLVTIEWCSPDGTTTGLQIRLIAIAAMTQLLDGH